MSRATLTVFILTLDVAAIAGNAVVILAFIVNRKLRKPSGCYVTNLAAADLCMSLIGIPFYVTTVIQDAWPLGDYFCAVWTGLERVCSLVSNFAIVGICFDRYWLVTKSSHYLGKHSVRSARWRIAGIWIAAILFRVPFVIYGMLETWGKLSPVSVCDPHSIYDVPFQVGIYEYDTIYTLIATLGEFVIPLVLIIIWGLQVYVYLEKREKQKLIKAVERSRAMSLDFTFPQRELANFYDEERRGSKDSRISFWSRYLSPDSALKKPNGTGNGTGNGNGLSRSRDTIPGPLSDLDKDPHENKRSPFRSSLHNGTATGWKGVEKSQATSNSVVDIVLDPASGGECGSCAMEESGKEHLSAAESECISNVSIKSNLSGRKSVSLNTLPVPSNLPQPLDDIPRGFPTSKSTPSIILTRLCDHNVLSTPSIVKKSGDIPLQVSFSLEDNENIKQGECTECQKQAVDPSARLLVADIGDDTKGAGGIRQGNSKERIGLSTASPARRRVVREGSTTSTCDFLDVPSRTHSRAQPQSDPEAEPLHLENDTTSGGHLVSVLDSVSVGGTEEQCEETRNSSFSSCASDLPDSISSIITVSEPPSPDIRRVSNMDAEEIQRVLNSRAKQRYRSYRRRALITILLMVCVFVVFQLPYVIVSCVYSFCTSDCVPDVVYESANWWYWAKVLLNPYLYAYISPEFRRYSIGILKCRSVGRK